TSRCLGWSRTSTAGRRACCVNTGRRCTADTGARCGRPAYFVASCGGAPISVLRQYGQHQREDAAPPRGKFRGFRRKKNLMTEDGSQAVSSLLQPLLRGFELLLFVTRHLHPPDFADLMASIGAPDADLQSARARTLPWPRGVANIGAVLEAASDAALERLPVLRHAPTYAHV